MTALRRLLGAATLIVGCIWLAASFDYIHLSSETFSIIWSTFLLLWGVGIILDWRSRKDQPFKEPSPAQSVRNVILFTGLAAAFATAHGAHALTEYGIPILIAASTMALAFVAFRLASRHRNQIGEARFDTTASEK